jgi:hypothetical protein
MNRASLLRILGIADVGSGLVGIAAASWLGDQLGLPTLLVAATGAFLVAFGIASLVEADRRAMAQATVVVEAVSAVTLLGLLAFGPTGAGAAIAVALAAWCVGAAVAVGAQLRTTPGPLAAT